MQALLYTTLGISFASYYCVLYIGRLFVSYYCEIHWASFCLLLLCTTLGILLSLTTQLLHIGLLFVYYYYYNSVHLLAPLLHWAYFCLLLHWVLLGAIGRHWARLGAVGRHWESFCESPLRTTASVQLFFGGDRKQEPLAGHGWRDYFGFSVRVLM